MGPVGHATVSTIVGSGVWAGTGSLEAGALTLGVGVLMDADHLFDYYQWYVKKRQDRIYVFLHAWEYSLIGLTLLVSLFYHPLFLATVAAHLSQCNQHSELVHDPRGGSTMPVFPFGCYKWNRNTL